MRQKNKTSLHRQISGGKRKGHMVRAVAKREFIQVQVLAPVNGAINKATHMVNLPLKKGTMVAVFEGVNIEISENTIGRSIVNVLGNHGQLIATKAIKSINRRSIVGRMQVPIRVSLSPSLNWCDYCGYVEKGHSCVHKSDG